MKAAEKIRDKICTADELVRRMAQWRLLEKTVAFTNGCFDIIHAGHIFSLSQAAMEADFLVVALNSDASVKMLKGKDRPFHDQEARLSVLASLVMVDAVVLFEEETPRELIRKLMPDVLVKGGDYTPDQIAGAAEITAAGGRVVIHPLLPGYSTTTVFNRVTNH